MLKDEFLPGDMGATKAKKEEVKIPLEIRLLDDDFGGGSCILVWMMSIPKLCRIEPFIAFLLKSTGEFQTILQSCCVFALCHSSRSQTETQSNNR